MADHLIFLLLGLANGAVFASLALALVVTFRSSGVVNFATSAIALYGSYTFAFLRKGELLVLIPGLPTKVDLGWPFPLWLAVIAALAMTSLLGLLLYGLVFSATASGASGSQSRCFCRGSSCHHRADGGAPGNQTGRR